MDAKFCEKCGHGLTEGARFCAHCGAAAPGLDASSLPPVALSHNAIAFFCYFFPVVGPVLFLNMSPYDKNPDIRFHAWQSLYFSVAWVVTSIATGVVWFPIAPLVHFALVVIWIILLVKALSGKKFALPIAAEMAEKKARE